MLRGATTLGLALVLSAPTTIAHVEPAASRVARQEPMPGPLPIDVEASPSRTLAGGQVKLSGKTGLTGPGSKATLRIRPPNAAPEIVLAVAVKSDGGYSAVFGKTGQLGVYQVQATAPDNKGQATTSFRVVAADVIPTEVGRSADSLLAAATQAIKAVEQAVQSLPASPERAEAEKRLGVIDQRLAQLPAQTKLLAGQMQKVFKARADVPEDNPQWDAYVEQLDGWQRGASKRTADMQTRIKAASAETQQCGRLDAYNEMLTMVSEAMSFVALPFDFSKAFWTDKIPGAFVARADNAQQISPEKRFVAVQTMKLGAAALEGPSGLIMAIPGLITDVAAYLVQQEFTKYCQKFEGPISGTFLGESFTKAGEPFFDYTIRLDGKLVLMYAKSAPANKPIGVLGYMEGNGDFDVRVNPKPIIRLTPGVVLFHKAISPPGGRYWDEVGQATRSVLPHSFRVPVKGTLAGDSIVLALQPPVHDFSAAIEGRSVYVIMPMGGLVPQIIDSKFALQKAYPILDRVIRGNPVLRVTYAGGTRAEGTFTRDTTNAGKTARARTKLTIKACNPGCLPLPGAPGKGSK